MIGAPPAVCSRAGDCTALAALFARGHDVDWRGAFPHGGRLVGLPTTPFRRQRYWRGLPPGSTGDARSPDGSFLPVRLGTALPIWEARLPKAEGTHVGAHMFDGRALLPMGVGLSMASLAARQATGLPAVQLADLAFLQPIQLGEGSRPRLQLSFDGPRDGRREHQASRLRRWPGRPAKRGSLDDGASRACGSARRPCKKRRHGNGRNPRGFAAPRHTELRIRR